MQTIWISPTEFVSGDPTVQISYPSADHPDTVVTSMEPGDFKWVSMGLPLPPAVALEEINVCYRVSDEQSFISQVRLLTMATPDQSVVLHDDGLDLRSTEPVCYASKVGGKLPSPGTSVRLALRLSFQNTTHEIRLGAVGVKFRPTGALCLNVRDAGAIGDGLSHPLSERYGSLTEAQADFPHATSLDDEIDWAAIQGSVDAVDSAGGLVCVPAGMYLLNVGLRVLRNGVRLRGVGRLATVLSFTNTMGPCIDMRPDVAFPSITSTTPAILAVGLEDLMVRVGSGHAADPIVRLRKVDRAIFRNVHLRGGLDGLVGDYGVDNLLLDQVWVDQESNGHLRYGVHLKRDCVSTHARELKVLSAGYAAAAGSRGLVLDTGLDTFVGEYIECGGLERGLQIQHATVLADPEGQPDENNTAPRWVRVYGGYFETNNAGPAVWIEDKADPKSHLDRSTDIAIVGGYGASSRDGFRIAGGVHVALIAVNAVNNRHHGINITGGSRIKILNSLCVNNSQASDNTYYGIQVDPGLTGGLHVVGNTLGNLYPASPAVGQKYGISLSLGPTDFYIVRDNDCRENKMGGVFDGASGTHKDVAHNWE